MWIPDQFSTSLAIAEKGIFKKFVSISHTFIGRFSQHSTSGSTTFRERSRRHQDTNPDYPEVWIRIPDHFRLRLDALVVMAEVDFFVENKSNWIELQAENVTEAERSAFDRFFVTSIYSTNWQHWTETVIMPMTHLG